MLKFIRIAWLNAVFWTLSALVTVSFAILGTLYVAIFALVVQNHRRTLWLLRRTISNFGHTILKCSWPLVRIRYIDHAPTDSPPFVFVCNHRSFSDGFLMAHLPYECIQVVNIWPFRIPLIGIVAKIAGYLSVRQMTFEQFLEKGSRLLAQGVSIVTFPEGTRSGTRSMGPFHGTAFRLAQHAHVNIVPIAISGNEYIPHRGSLVLHPGRIDIHKLPAITPAQYQNLSPFQLKTLAHDIIQRHLEAVES